MRSSQPLAGAASPGRGAGVPPPLAMSAQQTSRADAQAVGEPAFLMQEPPLSATTLLVTKLQAPVPRRRLVSRRTLLDSLSAATWAKLILVCAPAGSGKTTLLVDWQAAAGAAQAFAWLALDRGDNDPDRFWTYLVEALRTAAPELG